jgi:threonine dehydrogenase-like Zn-dependent dehydrogenase
MDLGPDWIHLETLPDRTLALGNRPGEWDPETVQLPSPEDGGLVLTLVAASVFRSEQHWLPGASAVWEVLACQEQSRAVPGLRIFSHPSPPCGFCPSCQAGCPSLCVDARIRPSGPGWFSRHRVLHPWSARRGTVALPSDLEPGAASMLEPLARILRVERMFPRRNRILAIGADLPSALAGMALEGPRRRVLLDPNPRFGGSAHGYHEVVPDAGAAREALCGPADLVLLFDGEAESVQSALDSLSPGTAIAAFVRWRNVPDLAQRLADAEATWTTMGGTSPEDWMASARRLPSLSARIEALPSSELPLEEAHKAHALLDRERELLRMHMV